VHVTASDLLAVPKGTITEAGLRQNLNVGIGYIEAWLLGAGIRAAQILMEDAATAEISRAQIWHGSGTAPNSTTAAPSTRRSAARRLTRSLQNCADSGGAGRYEDAAELFRELIEAPAFPEFLTMPATTDHIGSHDLVNLDPSPTRPSLGLGGHFTCASAGRVRCSIAAAPQWSRSEPPGSLLQSPPPPAPPGSIPALL
jgi:hypothetical protein